MPWLQPVFGTTAPQAWQVIALLPLPFVVWGADELWRWSRRRTPETPRPARSGSGRVGDELVA